MATLTATATATVEPAWIDATRAARLLETNYANVRRLAASGRIRMRRLPGTKAKYLRRSVEDLARSSVEEGL